MSSKRFLVAALLASLFVHAAVLALTGFIDMTGGRGERETLTVSLKAPDEKKPTRPAPAEPPPAPVAAGGAAGTAEPAPREDAVTLDNPLTPYRDYLLKVRHRIGRRWIYPPEAAARRQEGETVIRFSIAADGRLDGASVVTSAGSDLLDRAALSVIRSSAPFGPLPPSFRLDRLHIVARFQYRLKD